MLVPVGTTRTIEFIASAPGDWALHCHMTHHVMNQMGHDAANLIGADTRGLDDKLGRVVPGYMTMGQTGMGDMATMQMPQPKNSISMVGGKGPLRHDRHGRHVHDRQDPRAAHRRRRSGLVRARRTAPSPARRPPTSSRRDGITP